MNADNALDTAIKMAGFRDVLDFLEQAAHNANLHDDEMHALTDTAFKLLENHLNAITDYSLEVNA